MTHTEPARRPPAGLAGLDPVWSRLVSAIDGDGIERTWHVLDNWSEPTEPRLTLLCAHGNPSWSYLFRNLLRDAPADIRVVAVDHLDMGFSERTGTLRRLQRRIDDLDALSDALGIVGPTITVAHDWGGPISLGWAQRHLDQVRGVVLMNTAVHQPVGSPAPGVIRVVRSRPMLHNVTTRTTAFIRGAFALSEQRPGSDVRAGFLAPYATTERRAAIADFVADIPLEAAHPSAATLDRVAAAMSDLGHVPVLLLWGAADRVFSDLYLHDLEARLPHADVHRYPNAGHFVSEDTDALDAVIDWIGALDEGTSPGHLTDETSDLVPHPRAHDDRVAVAQMQDGRTIEIGAFDEMVSATASGLAGTGVAPDDRVALMIPPGIDLAATMLACWRVGAVVVLIDSGLGARGMSAAMRAAAPDHLVGIPKALAAARLLRWPGRRVCTTELNEVARRAIGAATDLPTIRSRPGELGPVPTANDIAAIAFTSGSTGPSKGVVYTHEELAAQRDAIGNLYDITQDDRLVAAFAPFALYGPMLGIPSVVPDMDVAAPGTLTATALGEATVRIGATLVFASPAAIANVVKTAADLTDAHRAAFAQVRLLLSAGAPVRPGLLRAAAQLFPNATASTPYGMTECLPVASISLVDVESATGGNGVCVGRPLPDVDVQVRTLDQAGRPTGELTTEANIVGEIVVRAPHARHGYDRLWHTEHRASRPPGWHSTGDVGHLDPQGRLWVGGRVGNVIAAESGPVTPVAIEQAVEALDGVEMVAVVGVGPRGIQQIVAVVEPTDPPSAPRLAPIDLLDRVRAVSDQPIVAAFEVPGLPVDRRHNSKVDRTRVARWAERALAGGRLPRW